MKKTLLTILFTMLVLPKLYASQSVITETEGYACMGDDKSRKETEVIAIEDAKRKASESSLTYIQAQTHVKDFMLEKDLISAYTNAQVKVIQEIEKGWYRDPALGDCYRAKLKVEVIPDTQVMNQLSKAKEETMENDPTAPLTVKVWTDHKEYKQGQKIKVYLRGNKPFYGRIVYKDAGGKIVQLLPNPFRTENYFSGGIVYEVPSGEDRYEMEVTPPFGSERITVYASTAPAGDIEVEPAGAVFEVKTRPAEIPLHTRGVKLVSRKHGSTAGTLSAAEFTENEADIRTGK
ncbi:MAG TPA: DUF4384 domain-containing protein [Desulfuromonadaceae bacterium]